MSRLAGGPRLEVRGRGIDLSLDDRAGMERAFRYTLGKFETLLRRVNITVSRAAGGDAGWVTCRITALDRSGQAVLVEGTDRDKAACVTRALRRAEREMRRRLAGSMRRSAAWPGAIA